MKKAHLLLFLAFVLIGGGLFGQAEQNILDPGFYEVNDFVDENENCLRCHGEPKFTIVDTVWDRTITESMCPDKIINRSGYYSGVHKSFACTDCHCQEFTVFPHDLECRIEQKYACMDCHGYDETYAQYNFEVIEEEFMNSTHNIDEFTCWKCHDPHSYKAFMRNTEDLHEAILYDNNMCLRCHGNFQRFMLLTERIEINIIESHDWLPNQKAHFESARCIECHTAINDTILIAHQLLPKTEAVKNCEECHSRDSRLMHTLYKFQARESRQAGFINGIILNDSFVIGANRHPLLNQISMLIFALTMAVIAIHIYFRLRTRKRVQS